MTEDIKENEDIEQAESPEINLYRLAKPTTLIRLAPRFHELASQLNIPGLTYEGLYVYFLKAVQAAEYLLPKGAKPMVEFTLVTADGIAKGFAHWRVLPIAPSVATCEWDYAYIWAEESSREEIQEALISRFIAFGRRNKCEFYKIDGLSPGNPFVDTVANTFKNKGMLLRQKENLELVGYKKE